MIYQKRKLDRQPLFSKPQIKRTRQIIIIPELCKGTSCKICITFCQNEVLELSTDEFNSRGNYYVKVKADEKCDECLNCYKHCPEFAIFLKPIPQHEPKESQSEES